MLSVLLYVDDWRESVCCCMLMIDVRVCVKCVAVC